MKVGRKLLVILSILIVLLVLSGFTAFRDYLIQKGVESVKKTIYIAVTKTTYSFLTETTTVKTALTEKITITITNTVTTTTTAWKTNEESLCVVFRSNKDVYKRSEPIILQLANNCDFDIVLSNSAPWFIINSSGGIVFSPIALQVVTIIKPGDVKGWVWDQKDNEGIFVPPGTYTVKLMTVNHGTLSITFRIE